MVGFTQPPDMGTTHSVTPYEVSPITQNLRFLTGASWRTGRMTMFMLRSCLIRLRLYYVPLSTPLHERILFVLDRIKNSAARTGAFRTSRLASLYAESRDPAFGSRRQSERKQGGCFITYYSYNFSLQHTIQKAEENVVNLELNG
jgi:hypothetical protein